MRIEHYIDVETGEDRWRIVDEFGIVVSIHKSHAEAKKHLS